MKFGVNAPEFCLYAQENNPKKVGCQYWRLLKELTDNGVYRRS